MEVHSDSSFGGAPQGCLRPTRCPLSQVREGAYVRIKQLTGSEDTIHRLREMGLLEEQPMLLLSHNSTVICRVCNVRMGISPQLAAQILVEPAGGQDRIQTSSHGAKPR
jgi:Fe2+ transport system protein FeoA